MGVLISVIANACLNVKSMTVVPIKQVVKLNEGENFSAVCDPYVVMIGKVGDHLELVLCKDGQERFGVSAGAEKITFQSTSYEQGLRIRLLDTDGDGLPDLRMYYRDDGTLVKTQLFFNGEFQDANRGEKGWMIGSSNVVFKEHKWQPTNLNDR